MTNKDHIENFQGLASFQSIFIMISFSKDGNPIDSFHHLCVALKFRSKVKKKVWKFNKELLKKWC